ncbi:response regulator transcription factor [Longispora sp. NPDC051575]|uniref:response regulator transcription factor n=1 Tax=Longispora sp. NPDC051575 TaxID=3154943 RepID=UPI00342F961A
MVRVLVVDDEALVRSGLGAILGSAGDFEVLTATGAEAVEVTRRHRPRVALVDIRMPDVDGLTLLRRLRALTTPVAVAMLTTFDMDAHVHEALRSGASGFLLKDTEPAELIAAVRALAAGGTVLSPQVATLVVDGYLRSGPCPTARARVAELSGRELDVLALLATGLSNAEIADRLYLASGTVKDHVSALLVKLRAVNRVQAAGIAHRAGVVERGGA